MAFVVAGGDPPSVSVGDLGDLCLRHIARYKRPKEYRFVDTRPTNNHGKVVKRERRDLLVAEAETDRARG